MKLFEEAILNPDKRKELAEKPHDICLLCKALSISCSGPNPCAMTYERLIEWCNSLAKKRGLTRAEIAEGSNIPLGTVNNFLSGRTDDIRFRTLQSILGYLIGNCWGNPCDHAKRFLDGEEMPSETIAKLEESIAKLIKELETEKTNAARADAYAADMRNELAEVRKDADKIRADGDKKTAYLRELADYREKKLRRCVVAVIVLAFVIVAALVVDFLNPRIGYFWLR